MASNLVTHKESALSMQSKFTILTQECFRRLHNTSDFLDLTTKVTILDEYMYDLKKSGYNEKDRKVILLGGVKTFSNLKRKREDGFEAIFETP